jgi:hypothetical protein
VVVFDSGLSNYAPVPNGFAGLNWSNFFVVNGVTYPTPSGYTIGVVSPEFAVYNGAGWPASFSSPTPFTFNSAYLTGVWRDGLTIEIEGLLAGTGRFFTSVTTSGTAATLFTFDWFGIDEVRFTSCGGTKIRALDGAQFAMDNLVIEAGAVPEPASTLPVAGGLAAAIAATLARRRAS